jgi:DnaA family protein
LPFSPQILLPLESRRLDRFEDFVAGPNQKVVSALHDLLASNGGCLFIRGPENSGKTHLLNAACNHVQQANQQAFYFSLARVTDNDAAGLSGLEQMDLVSIDDIDVVAGNPVWEDALFHFFNRIRASQGRLVIASSQALSKLPFKLPDLASRLAWGVRLALEPLDDGDKVEVLRRKAIALGVDLPSEVGHYLLSRGSRNISTLLSNLEAIRVAALASKRKVTVPLAREVLATR